MPSLADIPTTWPPPAPVVLSDSKDQISAVRVTALRAVTLRGIAGFIQGSGAGAASTQEGRFAVYSHDVGANRPDVLLEESVPFFIGRDDPIRGIEPAALLAPLDLDPGIYWIAIHLAAIVGQGKVQVRGLNTGGRTILQAPALYSVGMPDPFPAGGTAGVGRLGIGARLSPQPLGVQGAVVGTFLVGDGTLVGQPPAPAFNDPQLLLNGKGFQTFTFTDLKTMTPGKSSLVLKGKQVTVLQDSTVVPGKAQLLLNGKAFNTIVPVQNHMGKPALLLNGKAFALGVGGIVSTGKPSLILRGKSFKAGEVALLPTTPVPIDLVPSTPGSVSLTPSATPTVDLIPTTEEFR